MNTDSSVSTIMSRDVVTVAPETSVTEVARLMVEHDVSGIPVVDDGLLVGLVTEVDEVRERNTVAVGYLNAPRRDSRV